MTIQVLKEKGSTNREIARKLGVTEAAVRYQLRRQAEGRGDGRRARPHPEERLLPHVREWVEADGSPSRPCNIRHLHEHLVQAVGYAADEAGYRRLLRLFRRHFGRPRIRTYRRVETPPGAQTQTDWGEYPRVNVGDGPEPLHAFVMVLSHSRMPAIVWSRREDQVSWLNCHNESYRRLGGVAAVNRIDNVKTAISQGAGCWGTIHPTYLSYARTVGFHVDACQPREPQAKGKSEAKVRLSRLLVDVSKTDYDGVEELQVVTDDRITQWSKAATCPATGTKVHDAWEEEQTYLAGLPSHLPEPFDVSVIRPVHKDCMVNFEGRQYPVPFTYVGRHVEVRGCAGKVQLLFEGRILREHPRGTTERVIVDPSCYEGDATKYVLPPPPLGRMGRKLQEIMETPVEKRPVDLYAALMEVSR